MTLAKAIPLLLLICSLALGADMPPTWVQTGGSDPVSFPPGHYLTGYGLSSLKGTEAEQCKEALAMAREALASSVRTRVESEYTSRVTQSNLSMSRYIHNLVQTKVSLELDGLDTFLTWQDAGKHLVYALAVLDKPKTLQILQGQLDRETRECARTFEAARASGDVQGLLRARHVRGHIEEAMLVAGILSGGTTNIPACPPRDAIDRELRRSFLARPGLDGLIAASALDLGSCLPSGTKVFMDRITYADTPFCGSFSAYLEQALAADLVAMGQVKIIDKAAGREALMGTALEGGLPGALHSQAVVGGTCFELGEEAKLNLAVTSMTGEQLASASVTLPMVAIRTAGLRLAPENLEEARRLLAVQTAQVQATQLQVKLALDRGDGGIYRKGDKLYLFVKANLDCYVKILYHQVDGTDVLVFPNAYHTDGRILKDQVYQVPPDDNSFDLTVEEPFGVEMVKVIASTEPVEVSTGKPGGNGLPPVREGLASILGRTRGIALGRKGAMYAEDTAVVNTMAASKFSPR